MQFPMFSKSTICTVMLVAQIAMVVPRLCVNNHVGIHCRSTFEILSTELK